MALYKMLLLRIETQILNVLLIVIELFQKCLEIGGHMGSAQSVDERKIGSEPKLMLAYC
jgi:hypothetical protein